MAAGAGATVTATYLRELLHHHLLELVEAALAEHDEAHTVGGVVPAVELEQLLPDVHALLGGVLVESLGRADIETPRVHY